jgi:hypothetical protein
LDGEGVRAEGYPEPMLNYGSEEAQRSVPGPTQVDGSP